MSATLFEDVGDRPLKTRSPDVHFFVCCEPPKTTHHSKKIVRVRLKDGRTFSKLGDSAKLQEAISDLNSLFKPYQPAKPLKGPVALTIEITFGWLKSETKRNRAKGRIPKITKPDCSNAAKTIEDVLTRLRFIEDDNQVAALVVRKFHGDEAGILVRIDSLEEE